MGSTWVWSDFLLCPSQFGPLTEFCVLVLPELQEMEVGLCNFFIQHTSASLTINENASPDVPLDLADALDRIAPESASYRHSDEGADDMPGERAPPCLWHVGHAASSVIAASAASKQL